MLPKRGRVIPPGGGGSGHGTRYAEIIATALKTELGDTHRAVKSVRRWTGASERAVKNWLAGTAGPSGDHLLAILHHSDIALQMMLAACRRLSELDLLLGAAGSGPGSREGLPVGRLLPEGNAPQAEPGTARTQVPSTAPQHDPDRDPDDPDDPEPAFEPHARQRWFLDELAAGRRPSAKGIERHFGVAEKTAKRDVATLKIRGLIRFAGARRTGRYRLNSKRA